MSEIVQNPRYTGWTSMEAGVEPEDGTTFRYRPGTFRQPLANPHEAEVNVFTGRNWFNEIIPIKFLDESTRVVTLARHIMDHDRSPWFIPIRFVAGNRFRLENVLEELTEPGEWCFHSGVRCGARGNEHSVLADPLFVDPKCDDFRLRPESSALRLGFEPISIDRIGPRIQGELNLENKGG